MKRNYLEERCLEIARHIAKTGDTVRETGNFFKLSKSTIFKEMKVRLPELDTSLSKEVAKALLKNKEERAIRGGESTRKLWKEIRKSIKK